MPYELFESMDSHKKAIERWRKVNDWSFKGPLLVIALLLGFFDHTLHWGRATFAAVLATLIPVFGFRDLWREARFWITILLLGVLQIPLVMAVGSLVEQLKFMFMLAFGIFDCALIIAVVSWVCSEENDQIK
jgi:hypothetical protein